jgi:hypothetical protein
LANAFRVVGVLLVGLVVLAVYVTITEFRSLDSGVVIDLAVCLALLGWLSFTFIFRAAVLSRSEKWPAALACLLIVVTFVVSPRYGTVRGRMWGDPGTRNLYYVGALALGLAIVSLRRKGGGLAWFALVLSAFALFSGVSFLIYTFTH